MDVQMNSMTPGRDSGMKECSPSCLKLVEYVICAMLVFQNVND